MQELLIQIIVTLVQNGSDKIGGSTVNATLSTEGIAVTLVFIDSTQGWLVTDSGLQSEAPTNHIYVTATGGTITTLVILKFTHLQDQELLQFLQQVMQQVQIHSRLFSSGSRWWWWCEAVQLEVEAQEQVVIEFLHLYLYTASPINRLSNPAGITVSATSFSNYSWSWWRYWIIPPGGDGNGGNGSDSTFSSNNICRWWRWWSIGGWNEFKVVV